MPCHKERSYISFLLWDQNNTRPLPGHPTKARPAQPAPAAPAEAPTMSNARESRADAMPIRRSFYALVFHLWDELRAEGNGRRLLSGGKGRQSQIESRACLPMWTHRGMDQVPPPCCVGAIPLHHVPVCPRALAPQPRKIRNFFILLPQGPVCRGAQGRNTNIGRHGARATMSSLRGRPGHSCRDAVAASCGQVARMVGVGGYKIHCRQLRIGARPTADV